MKKLLYILGIIVCVLFIILLASFLLRQQDTDKEIVQDIEEIEEDYKESQESKKNNYTQINLEEYEGIKLLGSHLLDIVNKNKLIVITDKDSVDLYPSTTDFSIQLYVKLKDQVEPVIKEEMNYILHCLYESTSFTQPIGFYVEEEK